MSKLTYQRIVSCLALSRPAPDKLFTDHSARNTWYGVVGMFAEELKRDNPKWDACKFFDDCGVPN